MIAYIDSYTTGSIISLNNSLGSCVSTNLAFTQMSATLTWFIRAPFSWSDFWHGTSSGKRTGAKGSSPFLSCQIQTGLSSLQPHKR